MQKKRDENGNATGSRVRKIGKTKTKGYAATVKINENSNPDVPDDPEEENFFISLYKWIVKLIGMVITFIKSLYTTKAF